jgi:hexosaminidase
MSFLKLNRLHFHLTDDEGWRLEIPGIPELTSYGAKRGFDLDEDTMLHQALGSGNDLEPGDNITGKPADEKAANLGRPPTYQGFEQATLNFVGKGSGYYTTEDFENILAYAEKRHIQVIPEFDLPAHARAAVQAMEYRYERYKDSDPVEANKYRLLDPNDTSEHRSVQYYTDNLANPCMASTYAFLTKVVHEVKAMYSAAGALLPMVNLGGDEAPGPNRWQNSPLCQSNPETAGMSDKQLIDYFFARWHEIALAVAPRTAGWEDVLLAGTGNLRLQNFVALPWQNVWGWGREQIAYQFANAGLPVVLAHATNLYMDLAYNKDPDEPGYYWANFVDEQKTFTYQPFNVYANATHDRWGNPFTPDPNWEQLTEEGKQNILGMEAQLWGENGKSPKLREYQAFPKLLGVAERAWNRNTPTPGEMPAAWDVFVNTLGQVTFPLLSYYQPVGLPGVGVNYRIPLPGGKIDAERAEPRHGDPVLGQWRGLVGLYRPGERRRVSAAPHPCRRRPPQPHRASQRAPLDGGNSVRGWRAGDLSGRDLQRHPGAHVATRIHAGSDPGAVDPHPVITREAHAGLAGAAEEPGSSAAPPEAGVAPPRLPGWFECRQDNGLDPEKL